MKNNEFVIELDTRVLDRAIRELDKVDKTEMSAGYFNGRQHPVHTDSTYPDIAFINNYGWGNIPRRPFMSDAGQDDITLRTKLMAYALNELLRGKPYDDDLDKIAELMSQNIKNRIIGNSYVPNAESYKSYKQARWGSTDPLIASGNMRDNVEHKVTKKGAS
jgi:hypothetical protein